LVEVAGDAARWLISGGLWRLLGDGVSTTVCRAMRGSQKRDHRPRLLPDKEKGGGWRRVSFGRLWELV
jgi:hypothetical protein